MKKFALLLLVTFICSCTNEVLTTETLTSNANESISLFRGLDEAKQIAYDGLSLFDPGTRACQDEDYKICEDKVYAIKRNSTKTTRNASFDHDTLMYVINFEDDRGYAVVSANKATEPLIAITERGCFNPNILNYNDGLAYYLDCASSYVASTSAHRPGTVIDTTVVSRNQVGPLLDTKWGQSNYFGYYTPNNLCGCFPLAVMEVMSYYKYPSTMALSYPGSNDSIISIDWDDINNHKIYNAQHSSECMATLESHRNIARIAYEIGHRAHCEYVDTIIGGERHRSTGAIESNFIPCVSSFGYSFVRTQNYTTGCTELPLTANHPLIFYGFSSTSGHAWVVDGFISERLKIVDNRILDSNLQSLTYYVDKFYNHYNWGWNGIDNGYYLDNVFDVSQYSQLDSDNYVETDRNYNNRNKLLKMWP